jgi:cbb3-type cytochrome oxidase maturation protein
MQVLFIILPLALIIAIFFVALFVFAVKKGQFDDLDTPSHRILLNDENINNKEVENE